MSDIIWNIDTSDRFGLPVVGHTTTPGVHSHDTDSTQLHRNQTGLIITHPDRKICDLRRVPPQGEMYECTSAHYNRDQQLRVTWGWLRQSGCPSKAATIPDYDSRWLTLAGCVTFGRLDGAVWLRRMIFSCKIIGPLSLCAYMLVQADPTGSQLLVRHMVRAVWIVAVSV